MEERVILVDENDNVRGHASKKECTSTFGALWFWRQHSRSLCVAFSCVGHLTVAVLSPTPLVCCSTLERTVGRDVAPCVLRVSVHTRQQVDPAEGVARRTVFFSACLDLSRAPGRCLWRSVVTSSSARCRCCHSDLRRRSPSPATGRTRAARTRCTRRRRWWWTTRWASKLPRFGSLSRSWASRPRTCPSSPSSSSRVCITRCVQCWSSASLTAAVSRAAHGGEQGVPADHTRHSGLFFAVFRAGCV